MAGDKARERAGRAFEVGFRRHGIDHRVFEEVALSVERHNLAARAVARVEGEHSLPFQRRTEEELAEIVGEDGYGHAIRLLLQFG